ncbi:MAG: FGGY-family carbohydrate kinase [Geitlerinemataceae cyanobacterium]
MNIECALGIDFGTSGARAIVIDSFGEIRSQTDYPFPPSATANTSAWHTALFDLIDRTRQQLPPTAIVTRIAINGTSATVLLCDASGQPVTPPLLYNDGRGTAVLDKLAAISPANHTVVSATSSLAKLLWFLEQKESKPEYYFLHQADWLAFLLHGKLGISDYHNALKLGYDPANLCYPNWLLQGIRRIAGNRVPQLPSVVEPGTPIGQLTPEIAHRFGFSHPCLVCAGTTDSIAAFLASGVNSPGEAVTSLGSTLVLKLLSRTRVEDSRYGIYSHRLGNLWLTGGASNSGGAVLRSFFTDAELATLSDRIPDTESPLDYYPLLQPGERFPINDPQFPPKLEPRPEDSVEFLHGLLESIARIEARGYQLLQQLGATQIVRVYTAGGGAKNGVWGRIRHRHLHVRVLQSYQTEAAYGTALLASKSNLANTGLTQLRY